MKNRSYRRQDGARAGFTLIELLIVIAIIAILAGMVFRMTGYATRSALRADCLAQLEMLANALEEFRAEYGQYPPTSDVRYVYEDANRQTPWLRNNYFQDPQEGGNYQLYDFGLVSYLWPRDVDNAIEDEIIYHTNTWNEWIGDTERDEVAKKRWAPMLEEVRLHSWYTETNAPSGGGTYTNLYKTILDPWAREICYESTPPYAQYRLWSRGADGKTDIDAEREGGSQAQIDARTRRYVVDDIRVGHWDR
jgi:prepilin-type N-terminal cleavage/methylation domain-containing protein